MRLAIVGFFSIIIVAGCAQQAPQQRNGASIKSNVDLSSSIAGKTFRCTAEGPASNLTFGKDGKIIGELLNGPATGTWFSRGARAVEVHVSTGVIGIRDVLRPSGGGWAGRNLRCS